MITLSMFLGFALAFFYNPEMNALKEKIAHENGNITLIITICILLLTTIIIVGVFWLFYKLLYGILLKKLNNNYKELKKIDL
jgi:predicted PurR-regulated permease PerM